MISVVAPKYGLHFNKLCAVGRTQLIYDICFSYLITENTNFLFLSSSQWQNRNHQRIVAKISNLGNQMVDFLRKFKERNFKISLVNMIHISNFIYFKHEIPCSDIWHITLLLLRRVAELSSLYNSMHLGVSNQDRRIEFTL